MIEIATAERPTRFHRIVEAPASRDLGGPTWAPDSSMLAYEVTNGCCLDTDTFRQTIWVVNRDGTGRRSLRSDKGGIIPAPQALDLKHRRLFICDTGDGGYYSNFRAISVVTGKTEVSFEEIPTYPYNPFVYSEDFTHAYYARGQNLPDRLYKFSLGDHRERVGYRAPAVIDENGNHASIVGPNIVPHNGLLIIGVNDPRSHRQSIYRFDPRSDSVHLLLPRRQDECEQLSSAPVSPDGRFVVLDRARCGTTDYENPASKDILDMSNGFIFRFFEPQFAPAPSPQEPTKPGPSPSQAPTPLARAVILGWLVT